LSLSRCQCSHLNPTNLISNDQNGILCRRLNCVRVNHTPVFQVMQKFNKDCRYRHTLLQTHVPTDTRSYRHTLLQIHAPTDTRSYRHALLQTHSYRHMLLQIHATILSKLIIHSVIFYLKPVPVAMRSKA
jgi:hypothetical protein